MVLWMLLSSNSHGEQFSQVERSDNMAVEQHQNILSFKWNARSRLRRKNHKDLQRLRYQYIRYGFEGCHRLPLRGNTTNTTKKVINFINRKHSEAMIKRKKDVSTKKCFVITLSVPIG